MRWLCLFRPCKWFWIGVIERPRKPHWMNHGPAGLYQCERCKTLSLGAVSHPDDREQIPPPAPAREVKAYI